MRFHVTLTHTPESCPGPRGGTPVPDWSGRAKEVGVELLSAVVCQPAHTQFFVVETDEYDKLRELLVPFSGISKADISPVRDLMNT
ncbi:MAG: DUF3303 family protein [Dehalococcoidia bacterium]